MLNVFTIGIRGTTLTITTILCIVVGGRASPGSGDSPSIDANTVHTGGAGTRFTIKDCLGGEVTIRIGSSTVTITTISGAIVCIIAVPCCWDVGGGWVGGWRFDGNRWLSGRRSSDDPTYVCPRANTVRKGALDIAKDSTELLGAVGLGGTARIACVTHDPVITRGKVSDGIGSSGAVGGVVTAGIERGTLVMFGLRYSVSAEITDNVAINGIDILYTGVSTIIFVTTSESVPQAEAMTQFVTEGSEIALSISANTSKESTSGAEGIRIPRERTDTVERGDERIGYEDVDGFVGIWRIDRLFE